MNILNIYFEFILYNQNITFEFILHKYMVFYKYMLCEQGVRLLQVLNENKNFNFKEAIFTAMSYFR